MKKAIAVAIVGTAWFAPSAQAGVLTFEPTDDARVEQAAPDANFADLDLKSSSSGAVCSADAPCKRSYLRFDVALGANEKVKSARLEVTPVGSSYSGFETFGTVNPDGWGDEEDWQEEHITWNDRPAIDTSRKGVPSGPTSCTTDPCARVTVDVSPIVRWNGNATTIVLTSSVYFQALSKEDPGQAPKLIVETEPYSDTSPPTPPAGVVQRGATQTSAQIIWDPFTTDDVRVAGYHVYLNGELKATTSGWYWIHNYTGLACGSSYTATVRAFDPSSNLSPASAPLTIQTNPCGVALTETFDSTPGGGPFWVSEDAFWSNEAEGPNKDGVAENPRWLAESGNVVIDSARGKIREDVFRMWTRELFGDVKVTLDVWVNALPTLREDPERSGLFTKRNWDGAKLWLRRQLCTRDWGPDDPLRCTRIDDSGVKQQRGYTVEFAVRGDPDSRGRDVHVAYIQKRSDTCTGGYLRLSPIVKRPIPFGQLQKIEATVKDSADRSSVTIRLVINNALVASATDSGACNTPPYTADRYPGRIGLRGDNIDMHVDNLVVRTDY